MHIHIFISLNTYKYIILSPGEPKINMDAFKDVITVRAGQVLRLNVPFTGCPTPTAEWHRHDVKLHDDDRTKVERHETRSQLVLRDMRRADGGIYSLTVSNEAGRETANIHVNVIGE